MRNQIHGYHDQLRRKKPQQQQDSPLQQQPIDYLAQLQPQVSGPGNQEHRSVDSLGEVGRIMFPNYTWFNKVQTKVLDSVFYTNRQDLNKGFYYEFVLRLVVIN